MQAATQAAWVFVVPWLSPVSFAQICIYTCHPSGSSFHSFNHTISLAVHQLISWMNLCSLMFFSYGLFLFSVLFLAKFYKLTALFKKFQLPGITLCALTDCLPSVLFLSIELPRYLSVYLPHGLLPGSELLPIVFLIFWSYSLHGLAKSISFFPYLLAFVLFTSHFDSSVLQEVPLHWSWRVVTNVPSLLPTCWLRLVLAKIFLFLL